MRQGDIHSAVAYLVSSLAQAMELPEIRAFERHGIQLRIFLVDRTVRKASSSEVANKLDHIHLSLRQHWRTVLIANFWLVSKVPGTYSLTLLESLSYLNFEAIRCFLKASLLAKMLQHQPVMHLHAHFATAPTMIAMFTRQLTGVPYTFTATASDIHVNTAPKLLLAQLRRAEALVTRSECDRRYLSEKLGLTPNGKIRCIHEGVDISRFAPNSSHSSTSGIYTILSVGTLMERKGFSTLISAAHILRQRGYRFQLEIIGEGPLKATLLEKVERLGLNSHVSFLGAEHPPMIHAALQRATVFALACAIGTDGDRDDIPTALLEAMASGIPVVSTRVSGVPELIDSGSNGLLVDSGSSLALADAIETLFIDARLRDRLTYSARKTVESRFVIERKCEQWQLLFTNNQWEEELNISDAINDKPAGIIAPVAG